MTNHAREAAEKLFPPIELAWGGTEEELKQIAAEYKKQVDDATAVIQFAIAAAIVVATAELRAAYDAALCALEASDRKRRELEDRVMELEAVVKNYYPR